MIYKNAEQIDIKSTTFYNKYEMTLSGSTYLTSSSAFPDATENENHFWACNNETFSTTICLSGSPEKQFFEENVLNYEPGFDDYIVIALSKSYVNDGLYVQRCIFNREFNTDINHPYVVVDVFGNEKYWKVSLNKEEDFNFECYKILTLTNLQFGLLDATRGLFIFDLSKIDGSGNYDISKEYTQKILDGDESFYFNLKRFLFVSKEVKYYFNIMCEIKKNECLYSTNPTFVDDKGRIIKTKVDGSKDNVYTYATSIYFRDYDDNLLAVAKFNPVKIGLDEKKFNVRIFLR